MSSQNAFHSLHDAVAELLRRQQKLTREGIVLVSKETRESPVNVGFDLTRAGINDLTVKSVYVDFVMYRLVVTSDDYEEQEDSPHLNISVDGRVNPDADTVNLNVLGTAQSNRRRHPRAT